jgi:hypothetical protein
MFSFLIERYSCFKVLNTISRDTDHVNNHIPDEERVLLCYVNARESSEATKNTSLFLSFIIILIIIITTLTSAGNDLRKVRTRGHTSTHIVINMAAGK